MEAITPKLTEFIPAFVSFSLLFFVLSKFAFPPITKMLDDRANRIRESLEKAEETRVTAERLLEEYKQQMAEARGEAQKIIAQGRQVADSMKDEIVAKAQAEADSIVEKARQTIEAEKRNALAELQESVAGLSVAVAGKILGETMSADDHAALIEKFVSEAGGLNAN